MVFPFLKEINDHYCLLNNNLLKCQDFFSCLNFDRRWIKQEQNGFLSFWCEYSFCHLRTSASLLLKRQMYNGTEKKTQWIATVNLSLTQHAMIGTAVISGWGGLAWCVFNICMHMLVVEAVVAADVMEGRWPFSVWLVRLMKFNSQESKQTMQFVVSNNNVSRNDCHVSHGGSWSFPAEYRHLTR